MTDEELLLKTREYNGQVQERFRRIHSRLSAHLQSSKGFYEQLCAALRSGKYEKPSQYFLAEQDWIFRELIYPRFKEAFLAQVDSIQDWSYDVSWTRRGYRAPEFRFYANRIFHMLDREFLFDGYIDADLKDILSGNLPPEIRSHIRDCGANGHTSGSFSETVLAWALDQNDPELEAIVTDIINGEGAFTPVSAGLIRGILMSHNARMHELLCRLLLAVRLQEGLRQAICENADCGTKEAFRAILATILSHDLIRFSSVKRAVGTWLGVISWDTKDLDRISSRSVELLLDCLDHPEKRKEYLSSEDAMAIHIALWSYGTDSILEAQRIVEDLCRNGTHHQVLTASYFVASLENDSLSHDMARAVLTQWQEHNDILAVYLPLFLGESRSLSAKLARGTPHSGISLHFADDAEAERFCHWLMETHSRLKKKELVFDPCIFPWNKAVLKRSELLEKAMVIAALRGDRETMDALCPKISECDPDFRNTYFDLLTRNASTPAARNAVITGLSDKASYTRSAALLRCKEMALTPEEYLQVEDCLRLRYEDLRLGIMELLLAQSDDALTASVRRLLAASKTEKRTAGLDLLSQLQKQGSRKAIAEACLPQVKAIAKPTTQEQVLIDALLPRQEEALFTEADRYIPQIAYNDFTEQACRVFSRYFSDSALPQQLRSGVPVNPEAPEEKPVPCPAAAAAREKLRSLEAFFVAHERDTYKGFNGNLVPLGQENIFGFCLPYNEKPTDGSPDVPRMDLWKQWQLDSGVTPEELVGMYVLLNAENPQNVRYLKQCAGYAGMLYGPGFQMPQGVRYRLMLEKIIQGLIAVTVDARDQVLLGAALGAWVCRCLPEAMLLGDKELPFTPEDSLFHKGGIVYATPQVLLHHRLSDPYQNNPCGHFIVHPQFAALILWIQPEVPEWEAELIPITLALHQRSRDASARYAKERLRKEFDTPITLLFHQLYAHRVVPLARGSYWMPSPAMYLKARHRGLISERTLYYHLMEQEALKESLQLVTAVSALLPGTEDTASDRVFGGYRKFWLRKMCDELIGKGPEYTPDQLEMGRLCRETAAVLVPAVMNPELRRGDAPVEYSHAVTGIQSVSGAETFVRILAALGKDTLDKSVYYAYGSTQTRRYNLSHLLFRSVPGSKDTADTLADFLRGKNISRKRLIEAALFAPAWIDLVGEYLGISGFKSACYYFMAHMNEQFDDQKKAVIARYTPLEEEELNLGAFDMNWFHSAYEQLGEKDFDLIYDAAKYIAEGNKHTRARKFADAALGLLDVAQTEEAISDKRNKELVMAYGIIPLNGEEDLSRRYLFLQGFLKESRQFGAQRSASEKKAVDAAMRNLATNAGFADPLRLTLRMETKLVEDNSCLFLPTPVGEWVFRLEIDELGAAALVCEKDGKRLKSVPAKAKKEPHVVRLTEMKKQLTEQYRRTRRMFEQAMEDGSDFRPEELRDLYRNPVAVPILRKLVFRAGDTLGLFDGSTLVSVAGEALPVPEDTPWRVAHPVHLYKSGLWHAFQKHFFDGKVLQPFRQVFRELYVRTPEELEQSRSLRYAGNQIQPKKAAACLKQRRWVADPEMGLQKVYYKENIVATIYALADWFTPADIEAPTLEYVAFHHRKTGEAIRIADIPEVIFSEVMRDVDLAVSVAHAGGVDPQASHSTVEMRAAILEFVLPLLKLDNVTLKDNHAFIDGTLGSYSVHLGSGVVHQIGGTMLSVLPVHSQHRGRFFLPFADDDPKTAEIISKVIVFAEDQKLKDPTILSQISRI